MVSNPHLSGAQLGGEGFAALPDGCSTGLKAAQQLPRLLVAQPLQTVAQRSKPPCTGAAAVHAPRLGRLRIQLVQRQLVRTYKDTIKSACMMLTGLGPFTNTSLPW